MKRVPLGIIMGTAAGVLAAAWVFFHFLADSPAPHSAVKRSPSSPQNPHQVAPPLESPTAGTASGSMTLLTAEELRAWVAQLRSEPDPERKSAMRQTLASVRDPASADLLIQFLAEDGDPEVVSGAEQALLGMMSAPLMQKIISAYRAAAKPSAKKIALLVERVRTPAAFPILAEMLQASVIHADDPLILAALHTLAVTGTPYTAAVLARRLDQAATPDEEVILTNALAAVSSDGTVNELIAIAQGKQDVTRAATRVGAIRALANYPISQVRAALQELATDRDPQIASAAVQVLNSFTAP
jgi:HEAT repeat protein